MQGLENENIENIKHELSLNTSHKVEFCFGSNSKNSNDTNKVNNTNENYQATLESFNCSNKIGIKKSRIETDKLNSESLFNENPSIKLYDIYSNDSVVTQRDFNNQFDYDENLDIQIYISRDRDEILEVVFSKSIIYAAKHLNHQILKREKYDLNNTLLKKMKHEYEKYYRKNLHNSKSDDFILCFIALYKIIHKAFMIKNQNNLGSFLEVICTLLLRDLKNFIKLIQQTYGEKIIIPNEEMQNFETTEVSRPENFQLSSIQNDKEIVNAIYSKERQRTKK